VSTFSPRGDFLDGAWVLPAHPSGEIVRGDPGDDTIPVRRYPTCLGHVDRAVAAARRALPSWSQKSESDRVRFLSRLRGELASREDALVRAISMDMGKPLWESRQELESMRQKIDVVVDDGLAELALRRPVGVAGGYRYRPLGVVAVIGPYNFPARLPHGQAVTALVCGNTVVMKPSELAPATGELYAEAVVAAGAPPGMFQLVQGGADVGAALSGHADVDAVCFTGSYRTGLAIQRATIEQPGKVRVLEMGGKNATMVLADADLDQAAHDVVASAFITTGQRCTATTRLVVHRQLRGPLTDRIVELAKKLPIGYATEPVFMGPLSSEHLLARFLATVQGAEAQPNVETLLPAQRWQGPRRGAYVAPSVHLVKGKDASAYQREELFGPDLAIYEVEDLDEAIATANDSDYGLCASIYTRSESAFAHALETTQVGLLNWNRPTIGSSTRMPFAGLGKSGNQRDGGVHLIRSLVHPIATLERPAAFDAATLPPYFPRR
jgi:succinylglutamic semialdehyde dehydrogenase